MRTSHSIEHKHGVMFLILFMKEKVDAVKGVVALYLEGKRIDIMLYRLRRTTCSSLIQTISDYYVQVVT